MQLKQGLGAIALACAMAACAAPWTPPAQPDVGRIDQEAGEDARAGRLEEAAAKRRWYHAHALAFAPSHSGVRRSFAMSDWYELARRYPPAMQDMLDAQDKAQQAVRAGGPDAREAMADLSAFAEQLGDPRPIASVMSWLDANRPADARRFAHAALPALVTAQEAALAVRYLDAEAWLRERASTFETLSQYASPGRTRAAQLRGNQDFVERDAAFAVAALVKAGRPAEAAAMVERLRAVLGSDAKMHACSDALRGHAPPLRRY